jgi:hypothetical protein
MKRLNGPTLNRRTRRSLVIPVLLALLFTLLFPFGAQAVHATGAFELDGNAVSQTTDDWDRVCHQVTITNDTTNSIPDQCAGAIDTTGATAVAWADDGSLNATIFTGGGSKDPIDINQWAWKDGAGGLPDKDNLLHSFAARYSLTPNASTCPSGGAATCEVLFFGSDRLDNSGDAQQGFWFFQNKITLGTNKIGGGTGFNGVHKNGDILVISDFSVGGTTSTITVYKWNSAVSGNLELLETSDAAKCSSALPTTDAFCGIVNPTDGTTAPWNFTDKSGFSTYLAGEFYEGGLNLSTLGLGNECFSSIASETRSSTSTTATLKDFVIGQFAQCGATMDTTPSTTALPIGLSLTDSATITVTGGSSPPAPTGTVKFYVCGPSVGLQSCDATGNNFSTVNLSTASVNGNKYTVASTALTPSSAGDYCFFATWAGDLNYPGGASHDSANECFTVTPRQPTIVTSQTAGPLTIGSSISDTATLGNTANKPDGSPAGGTITFRAYGPQADPSNPVCTGTAVYTSAAYTVSGNGTYPTALQAAASFVPTQAGQYNWVATYSGDLPNTLGVASNCADEASIIVVLQPTMDTAQRFVPNDSATVTVASGAGNLTGTVRFRLYDNSTCAPSGTTLYDKTFNVVTDGTGTALSRTVSTDNATAFTTSKSFSWLVEYTSTNAGIKNVTSVCHNENSDLTINNGSTSNTP